MQRVRIETQIEIQSNTNRVLLRWGSELYGYGVRCQRRGIYSLLLLVCAKEHKMREKVSIQ